MVTIINADHQPAVFVGIDWGGTHHQVCAVNAEGVVTIQHKIEHTVAGLAEIDSLLDTFAETGTLRVSVERAEGILVEHLLDRGRSVFCISPKISARARERYRLANTKSDAFDAFVLAETLRHEHVHWRPIAHTTPGTAQIAARYRGIGNVSSSCNAPLNPV